jgi:two-component system, cell cycle response regulator DivK
VSAPLSNNMAHIIVIEDNAQTARMVAKLLRMYGHTVDSFQTGEEGMLKIIDAPPDLILIDLGLPDIDGQTVIAILRQQCDLTATPVIAFTAWTPSVAREMAKAYGCDGVITKPIDTRTFTRHIEAFLCTPKPSESSDESQSAH